MCALSGFAYVLLHVIFVPITQWICAGNHILLTTYSQLNHNNFKTLKILFFMLKLVLPLSLELMI